MNRTTITLLTVLLIGLLAMTANAQDVESGRGKGVGEFIDEDGDGFNDLAPDADGDGIPNGMDEDFVKPEDGSGSMHQNRFGTLDDETKGGFGKAKNGEMGGNGYGPGDGTGEGLAPADGTGFGPGTGDGTCDGTGDDDSEDTDKVSNQRRGNRG